MTAYWTHLKFRTSPISTILDKGEVTMNHADFQKGCKSYCDSIRSLTEVVVVIKQLLAQVASARELGVLAGMLEIARLLH